MNTTTNSHGSAHEEFELAEKAVQEAYANFLTAKRHLKQAASAAGIELKERANEQLDEVLGKALDARKELQENTTDYVRENPLTSVGIAFLGGVVLSRLLGK